MSTTSPVMFSSDIIVRLVDCMASDESVVRAARVSNVGQNEVADASEAAGLIRYLMSAKHGSPFEHNSFTFYVKAPLFVVREWQRHRMSSFNEKSGRYSVMEPEFYIPPTDRKVINIGTSARPEFEADENLIQWSRGSIKKVSRAAWREYEAAISLGTANEVARMLLPLNLYTEMYWTVNARSLMNFLSLRVDSPDARVRTRPQIEIQWGAEKAEKLFAQHMPITHAAFVANGRVAP